MDVFFGSFYNKMTNSPLYLFQKLSRYIAVSTTTGDFYDVEKEDYYDLLDWQKYIEEHNSTDSYQAYIDSVKACDLPDDVLEFFPMRIEAHGISLGTDANFNVTDLTLNITSECNLNCLYCWNDQGSYSGEGFSVGEADPKKKKDMPLTIAKKAVDILLSLCGDEKDLVVDFYGGEPLLNINTLKGTVAYCKEMEKKHNVKFSYLLATNGTLLTAELSKELIELGVQIALSIDGPKKIHNHNRPFANGDGSFDTIMDNLDAMPEDLKKKLVGRTTVTPSYPSMTSLYDNLKELGFERMEIFESEDACHKVTDKTKDLFFTGSEEKEILYAEYERLALLFIEEVLEGKLNYAKTFFNRFFKLMQRLYYNEELVGGCPAATGQIAVSADGSIYPCTSFLGIDNFCLGNVNDSIDKIKYEDFINQVNDRSKQCSECELYSVCKSSGSCLNVNYYFNDNVAVPHKPSCELFKEKIKLAIASLCIITEKIPDKVEELFGHDSVGRRGNSLY